MPTPARCRRADACRPPDGTPGSVGELSLSLRAPVFALSTVLLSTVAHVLGGGGVPEPWTVLLLVVAVDVTFRAVARGELSLARVTAGVALAQLGLHLLLAAGSAGHPTGHGASGPTEQVAAARPVADAPGGASGLLMVLAHVAAAVALGWWLRRGEAAAWRVARRLIVTLLRPRSAARVERPAPGRRSPTGVGPARSLVLALAVHPHRGPPSAV